MTHSRSTLNRFIAYALCVVLVVLLATALVLHLNQRDREAEQNARYNRIQVAIGEFARPIASRLETTKGVLARPDANSGSRPLRVLRKSRLPMLVFQVVRNEGRLSGVVLTDILDDRGHRWFVNGLARTLGRGETSQVTTPEAIYALITRAEFVVVRDGLPYSRGIYEGSGAYTQYVDMIEVQHTIVDVKTFEPVASVSFRHDGALPREITATVGPDGKTKYLTYDLKEKRNPWDFDLLKSFVAAASGV